MTVLTPHSLTPLHAKCFQIMPTTNLTLLSVSASALNICISHITILFKQNNRFHRQDWKMKEARKEKATGINAGRSAFEREKTKMRERQRRSITTNIFHGLRKHGGYRLSPRADINEVLRHLAQEAGWIVKPDGTTYRSTTPIFSVPLNFSSFTFTIIYYYGEYCVKCSPD